MGRVSGAALIIAGLGMAGYAMHWANDAPADAGRQGRAEAVPSVAAPSVGQQKISVPPAMAVEPRAAAIPATPKRHARLGRKKLVQVVVVARVAPSAATSRPPASSGPPLGRTALTQELQRELKRVGCYQGRISGVWTPSARRSMKAFTNHLNATLPVDQPDHVLLAMLQNHDGRACGNGCAAGQARGKAVRCRQAELAATATGGRGRADGMPVQAAMGATSDPTTSQAGRMSLAGPKDDAPIQGKREPGVGAVPVNAASATKNQVNPGIPGRRRAAGRRVGSSPSGPPAWVPWARPWAMN